MIARFRPVAAALILLAGAGCVRGDTGRKPDIEEVLPVNLTLRGRDFHLVLTPDPDQGSPRPLAEQFRYFPSGLSSAAAPLPTDLEILEEMEEIAWAAGMRSAQAFDAYIEAATPRQPGGNPNALIERLYLQLLDGRAAAPLQDLFDRQQALLLVTRALRRDMGYPEIPGDLGHFTQPQLNDGIRNRLQRYGYDPGESYLAFRLMRAVCRPGDPALLEYAVQYPLYIDIRPEPAVVPDRAALARLAGGILDKDVCVPVLGQVFASLQAGREGIALGGGTVVLTREIRSGQPTGRLLVQKLVPAR